MLKLTVTYDAEASKRATARRHLAALGRWWKRVKEELDEHERYGTEYERYLSERRRWFEYADGHPYRRG